jgi:hypothetical protein
MQEDATIPSIFNPDGTPKESALGGFDAATPRVVEPGQLQ